tara:strand:+ start:330 stop:1409 length:1080 start_codon:yes stop_codon:yes gene_type:complete
MKYILKYSKLVKLYNFFLLVALINIFFSTENSYAKTFSINEIEISKPFQINFNKNEIIDEGFVKAFNELILSILQSKDQKKLNKITIRQIKGMIETFSIIEETFIDEIYYLKLNVSFNKKNVFRLLETKNIFPSLPNKKNLLIIPVIVDETKNQVLLFSENTLFNNWNLSKKKYDLLNYILPTEDLEDFNIIKKNIKNLENYNFKEIIDKYSTDDYIIIIVFKNSEKIRVFNKISYEKQKKIKNFNFIGIDLSNPKDVRKFIESLKLIYEDFWKSQNEINTSLKISLNISIQNNNNLKIDKFENILSEMDLIYNFSIYKFNNKNNFYRVIFNGTPDKFIEIMKSKNYEFEVKNNIWVLR